MKRTVRLANSGALLALLGAGFLALSAAVVPLRAQSQELQQKLAEVKDSMAVIKMLLAPFGCVSGYTRSAVRALRRGGKFEDESTVSEGKSETD